MQFYEDETTDDAMQAACEGHLGADLQMASLVRASNAVAAARAAGRCAHQGAVEYRSPAVYPAQEGLRPGQLRCTDGCGAVFDDEEAWYAAIDEAVE